MDDGCTADGGAKSARKLAADETVAGALGAVCAPAAAAAARIFGRTNLPFLVTSARSPEVLDPARAPSTFLLPGTPYQEALAAAHWLALEGVQRLAAVAEEDADSQFLVDKLAFVADPVPKLVSRQTVTREGLDAELVAGAALASNPDVVYWAGSAAGAGRLVAALRSAGYKGIFLASSLSRARRSSQTEATRPRARSSSLLLGRSSSAVRARGRGASATRTAARPGTTRCRPTMPFARWRRRSRRAGRSSTPATPGSCRASTWSSRRRSAPFSSRVTTRSSRTTTSSWSSATASSGPRTRCARRMVERVGAARRARARRRRRVAAARRSRLLVTSSTTSARRTTARPTRPPPTATTGSTPTTTRTRTTCRSAGSRPARSRSARTSGPARRT